MRALLRAILDYETRSKRDLKLSGAIEYAKDPSTSILCLGYQIDHHEAELWIPERSPMPPLLWKCFQEGILIAHNAAFERAITRYVLPRYDTLTSDQKTWLIQLHPRQWRCLAAKAAYAALPRKLEGAAKALELATQKDQYGHKLILKYSKPRRPSKHNPSPWWTNKKDLKDIYKYCLTDVKAEWELDQALPDLSPFEQKVWELDQKINDRGVLLDIPTVKKILTLVNEETEEIIRRVQVLSEGEVQSPSQRDRMLKWLNKRGACIANLQSPTIRDRLLGSDLTPEVRQMLEYRQSGSKTSTAKYLAMIHAVGDDHRARELLLYWGTTPTARWAGKRLQPQNFPRPTVKEPGKQYFDSDLAIQVALAQGREGLAKHYGPTQVMNVLVSIIRGMIIASPGHKLFCADFAAVEARVAFWVAEHADGIRAFQDNRKLYEEMASAAFGIPIEKITKESLERFVGKESVLGCQYGLGHVKFLRNCHQKGVKQVTEEMAKKAVYTYRRVHHPIPKFWRDIEQACIRVVLNPTKQITVTKVKVFMSDHWLCIKIPSGRLLKYFKPRVVQKQLASEQMVPEMRYWAVDGYTRKWTETSIWGGVFTNHIVQGIARDLMVNGVIQIENAGYQFLLSVHDEGLSEHQNGEGSVEEYTRLMTTLPNWAKGCPITAEGWSDERYRK